MVASCIETTELVGPPGTALESRSSALRGKTENLSLKTFRAESAPKSVTLVSVQAARRTHIKTNPPQDEYKHRIEWNSPS